MTVRELYSMLENKYPRELSASWDNDGLMCCADPGAEVKKVLLSLDATKEAIEYAAKGGFAPLWAANSPPTEFSARFTVK